MHLALPKSLWASWRVYALFVALDSARRFPKMRDRSLIVKNGFPVASFPVANEKSSSIKGGCANAWLGWSDVSSPEWYGIVSHLTGSAAETLLTGERSIVFHCVMQANLLQIKRITTEAFVQNAGRVMARIVAE